MRLGSGDIFFDLTIIVVGVVVAALYCAWNKKVDLENHIHSLIEKWEESQKE